MVLGVAPVGGRNDKSQHCRDHGYYCLTSLVVTSPTLDMSTITSSSTNVHHVVLKLHVRVSCPSVITAVYTLEFVAFNFGGSCGSQDVSY